MNNVPIPSQICLIEPGLSECSLWGLYFVAKSRKVRCIGVLANQCDVAEERHIVILIHDQKLVSLGVLGLWGECHALLRAPLLWFA